MDTPQDFNMKEHWNTTYERSPEEKLGWYETDVEPTMRLISMTGLPAHARILNVGAGSTTLVDELILCGYKNVIATDISEVSLYNLENRLNKKGLAIEMIVDDLLSPVRLHQIEPVDLWIDRAVLHFFTDPDQQKRYFNLLNQVLKVEGYVVFAEFNLEGAKKCSGLPVHRYNENMMQSGLGNDFQLITSFNHVYTMPSGDQRPYIYSLFKRINEF